MNYNPKATFLSIRNKIFQDKTFLAYVTDCIRRIDQGRYARLDPAEENTVSLGSHHGYHYALIVPQRKTRNDEVVINAAHFHQSVASMITQTFPEYAPQQPRLVAAVDAGTWRKELYGIVVNTPLMTAKRSDQVLRHQNGLGAQVGLEQKVLPATVTDLPTPSPFTQTLLDPHQAFYDPKLVLRADKKWF